MPSKKKNKFIRRLVVKFLLQVAMVFLRRIILDFPLHWKITFIANWPINNQMKIQLSQFSLHKLIKVTIINLTNKTKSLKKRTTNKTFLSKMLYTFLSDILTFYKRKVILTSNFSSTKVSFLKISHQNKMKSSSTIHKGILRQV